MAAAKAFQLVTAGTGTEPYLKRDEWPEQFWEAFGWRSPIERSQQGSHDPADPLQALRGSVLRYTDPLEPACLACIYADILPVRREAMPTAKVFQSGNSQAVRLPKDFRFPVGVEEVSIRRQGDRLILEPLVREEWPEDFWQAFGGMSPDFERPRQVPQSR